jgi:hypothetical protein
MYKGRCVQCQQRCHVSSVASTFSGAKLLRWHRANEVVSDKGFYFYAKGEEAAFSCDLLRKTEVVREYLF